MPKGRFKMKEATGVANIRILLLCIIQDVGVRVLLCNSRRAGHGQGSVFSHTIGYSKNIPADVVGQLKRRTLWDRSLKEVK